MINADILSLTSWVRTDTCPAHSSAEPHLVIEMEDRRLKRWTMFKTPTEATNMIKIIIIVTIIVNYIVKGLVTKLCEKILL